jgi:hypothetical protein
MGAASRFAFGGLPSGTMFRRDFSFKYCFN